MKNKFFLSLIFLTQLLFMQSSMAQGVRLIVGSEVVDDQNFNQFQLIDCDESSFFALGEKTQIDSNYFFIGKYAKQGLRKIFSVSFALDRNEKLVNAISRNGDLVLFKCSSTINRKNVTLSSQVVSSNGQLEEKISKIASVENLNGEFSDFGVRMNPSSTKFLVQSSYRRGEGLFVTDFTLLGSQKLNREWTKTVEIPFAGDGGFGNSLKRNNIEFLTIDMDDKDNIFYSYKEDRSKPSGNGTGAVVKFAALYSDLEQMQTKLTSLDVAMAPHIMELPLNENYFIEDVGIAFLGEGMAVIGGYFRTGTGHRNESEDSVGIFSIYLDLNTLAFKRPNVTVVDKNRYAPYGSASESDAKQSGINYKLDDILMSDGSVFFVGHGYMKTDAIKKKKNEITSPGSIYEYGDIMVSKQVIGGDFEWVNSVPYHEPGLTGFQHLVKRYIALRLADGISIVYNNYTIQHNPKNASNINKGVTKKELTVEKNGLITAISFSNDGQGKQPASVRLDDLPMPAILENNSVFMTSAKSDNFISGRKPNESIVRINENGVQKVAKLLIFSD